MEVFPSTPEGLQTVQSLLHVRGGVSRRVLLSKVVIKSSPRPWRCFYTDLIAGYHVGVFSTSVEVFLYRLGRRCGKPSLLHVRGGVSSAYGFNYFVLGSSPRPWRCFLELLGRLGDRLVFSTSVEVFLLCAHHKTSSNGLLHVRGGVSGGLTAYGVPVKSSPRPWRCFLALGVLIAR